MFHNDVDSSFLEQGVYFSCSEVEVITDAVTYYYYCAHILPIYTVEKNWFIKMLQTMDHIFCTF